MIELITPKLLLDYYKPLSKEQQIAFLKLLGSESAAEVPIFVCSALSLPERERFARACVGNVIANFFPQIIKEARRIAREEPAISDEDFEAALTEAVRKNEERNQQIITDLEKRKAREEVGAILKQAEPLLRTGKRPKLSRNEIIHRCLIELDFSRDQIYRHMLVEHPKLMMIRKKKKPIGEASMWTTYNLWLKKKNSST